jgi:serine/threonine-protein kinase
MSQPGTTGPGTTTGPGASSDERAHVGTTYGSYRVTGVLGKGGMGTVFSAEHVTIGKRAAIKILNGEYAKDPNIVARFFREARIVNEIRHENIVDIFDFGTEKDGTPYFVMELLEGEAISSRLKKERPFPENLVLDVGVQVAQALAAVHRMGVVHRDLKPDNIFLVERAKRQNFVKLLDFGIAKVMEGGAEDHLTRTGTILGTPVYMAPEQIKGRSVDQRTDVYSLGAILYELATGRPPFMAGDGGVLRLLSQHLMEDPEPPRRLNPNIGGRTEEAIMRCLRKEAGERFNTMSELAAALERGERAATHPALTSFTAAEIPVPALTMAAGAAMAPKKSNTPLIAGGVAVVLLGGGIAAYLATRPPAVPTGPITPAPVVAAASGDGGATAATGPAPAKKDPAKPDAPRKDPAVSAAASPAGAADAGAKPSAAADAGAGAGAGASGTAARPPSPPPAAPEVKKTVRVELASEPAGAEVMEGPRFLGQTPVVLEVASTRQLVVSLAGFRDQAVELAREDAPRRSVALVALKHKAAVVKAPKPLRPGATRPDVKPVAEPPAPRPVKPPGGKKGIGLED